MRRSHFFFLILLTTLLIAQDERLSSKVIIDGEHYSRDHESAYGICNHYALVIAEHQIETGDALLFYYGTTFGIVSEGYSTQNGYGLQTDTPGIILKSNIGLKYTIEKYQTLSLENSHIQDRLHDQVDSWVELSYYHNF